MYYFEWSTTQDENVQNYEMSIEIESYMRTSVS